MGERETIIAKNFYEKNMSIVVIIGLIFVIIAILIFIAGKNINQNTNQRILVDEFE